MAASYRPNELLICVASRLMRPDTTAFIGTGIPMLAASLAQRMHAKSLMPIFEFGGIGAQLERLPLAVGDMGTFHRALMAAGICDAMEFAQLGYVDYGFLGGAQIDPYGNLNSTVIGDQRHPKVRLPGSGGANDVGSCCWRTIILMQHDRRRFLETIDFVTTPGYLTGPGAREAAGLPRDTGPYRVVTNLATLDFHPDTKRMRLIALNPGVTREQVVAATGFPLLVADELEANPPPSDEELRILREEIDKDRFYI